MDGMEAVIEAPIESTPVETTETVETPETTEVPTEQPEVESQETEQPEVDGDGRALPKDVQAALKQLRDANPKVAEALRKAYFSSQQFGQLYKNPAEAKSAKIALETAGGPEGIATMREAVQNSEFLEKAAEAGDPSVIENWSKDFPDGFKKAMPHALKQFQKMDQQGFTQALQPHVYGAMETAGLGQVLESMWEAIAGNKPDDVKSLIQKTYKWLEGQKALADKSNTQTLDPGREKFETERKKFEGERQSAFLGDIGRDTSRHQQTAIETALTAYLKGKKLTPEGKTELGRVINAGINDTLKGDQAYQRQVKTFLGKKDADGAKRFINDHLDTIVPGIVQSKWRALYGSAVVQKPVQQPNGAKPTIQGGPLKVAAKPPLSEVSKEPGYMEAYIAGKAIMANGPNKGKLVTWR
jgi:hypothetical protein